jgi:hypothetical protein
MSMATKPGAKLVTNTQKRPSPRGPRRLSAQTEAQIRTMIEQPGFRAPTVALLMQEVDALRAENAELRGRLGEDIG